MMNKKRTIATLASMLIGINAVPITDVNAKVIEPEIVKTETWTTSYYIDDDINTLYPYIDCQADIYNDGTVKVYFWNTHEWDGFATVKHNIILANSLPVNNESIAYSFSKLSRHYNYFPVFSNASMNSKENYKFWESKDVGFYPNVYNYKLNHTYSNYNYTYYYGVELTGGYGRLTEGELSYIQYNCALPELSVDVKSNIVFSPTTELTETYDFYVLGHNFSITPEILSSNIIAEPVLTDTEKRIQELEKENAELKAQNNNLIEILNSQGNRAYGDMNNDNIVDGRDATILLTYYAKTSVGYVGSLDDFIREQNGE